MTAPAFCPRCGVNLSADAPVEIDGWRVTTTGAWNGARFTRLTASEAIILHSIAAARGELVHGSTLSERIDHDGDGNVVCVLISRIRKKLPGVPVETVWGAGYRWATSEAQRAA